MNRALTVTLILVMLVAIAATVLVHLGKLPG